MALEIEAKVKVADHDAVRRHLQNLGAELVWSVMEDNLFLDTPEQALLTRQSGLRVRTNRPLDGHAQPTVEVTFKGPRRAARLKTRPETQFVADDADSVIELFNALGYMRTLAFDKRRERWRFGPSTIELDELPQLGCFVEIEGPDESTIEQRLEQLGLSDQPLIQTGYVQMVAEHLGGSAVKRELRF